MRCANEVRNPNTQAQLKKRLWRAVEFDDYKGVVDALIAGASIDARDINGYTPLLWAVNRGHAKVAILLLVCGASTNVQPKHAKTERSITYYAREKNNTEILNALANLGMEISAT